MPNTSATPPHPMLSKQGPLTPDEMLDMIAYEGLVGLGLPEDVETARILAAGGLVELSEMRGIPHITYNGPLR